MWENVWKSLKSLWGREAVRGDVSPYGEKEEREQEGAIQAWIRQDRAETAKDALDRSLQAPSPSPDLCWEVRGLISFLRTSIGQVRGFASI